jgi:hypothetical protein
MLWWFEREGQRTRLEVLHLPAGAYELRLIGADGVEHVEHFPDAADLAKRQQEIQQALVASGWRGPSTWII